jgi:hypothetical protein
MKTDYTRDSCSSRFGGRTWFERRRASLVIVLWIQLKKQKEVTSKRNRLMMIYQFHNWGRRIQRSVSHPTTPEKWNITIVDGKFMSAMVVTAWQNKDVKNRKQIGDDWWKGLVLKPWYIIPIEPNSKLIRMV